MGKLTDTQLKAWVRKGDRIPGRSDGGGLTFTLSKGGAAVWVLRYRFNGRSREYTIGSYPEFGLAKAREEAVALRGRIQSKEDVAATKQVEKEKAETNASTFKGLAETWLARDVTESTRQRVESTLKRYAYPVIENLPPDDIHPQHIDKILLKALDANAPTTANDLLRYLKRVFTFARKRKIVADNPAKDFDSSDAGGTEKPRERSLSLKEIKQFLEATTMSEVLGRDNELAFRLLLMLGVRKSELVKAAWDEFDLGKSLWILPSDRAKKGSGITIPLPPAAVAMLQELKIRAGRSEWVFPARRTHVKRWGHISPDTLNVALSRLDHGLPHFTVHDLRRTVRTQLAALKIPPHIAERVLNHKLKGMERVYDQYDYFDERKGALNQWARCLEVLEVGAEIVPIAQSMRDGVEK
jgi:integrase